MWSAAQCEAAGQGHLLKGLSEAEASAVLEQLGAVDASYPNGVAAYVKNARALLEQSRDGVNPYDGYTPAVPHGERLEAASEKFAELEERGMEEIHATGFVLVAGGLGERLGYNGIKIELPAEILSGKSFMENYCESILALQSRARQRSGNDQIVLPLAIMTSGDTHEKTVALLEKHDNFGMGKDQITLMKQELVPAMLDNDARFAQETNKKIELKPHGHGDVHSLLHGSSTLEKWQGKGIRWIVFFQDTNGIVFRAVPSAVGVSAVNDFDVNSLTVPRKPGEAVGGICKLNKEDGTSLTINVEYNQLDPLLRATVSPEGDVPDASGFSPYPGNINVLVFKLEPYLAVLNKTGGNIPEFVNPKYADASKTTFKKPTRLECMMQDYPKLLVGDPDAKVGFTQMERFMCFSAVKNNPKDALDKLKSSGFAESASSGEADIYALGRYLLGRAGVKVQTEVTETEEYLNIPVPKLAKIVLAPSFGTTVAEVASHFPNPSMVVISNSSSLLIQGDVEIQSLELDGSLELLAPPGQKLVVNGKVVKNKGVEFAAIKFDDLEHPEPMRIRGYVKKEHECEVLSGKKTFKRTAGQAGL